MRREPRECSECGQSFVPAHAKTLTCSHSCGYARDKRKAAERRVSPEPRSVVVPLPRQARPDPKVKTRRRLRTNLGRVRFLILERDNFRCVFCGTSATESRLEVDHLVPVSRGGGDESANLAASCIDCNAAKSNMMLSDEALAELVAGAVERCRARGINPAAAPAA